VAVAVTVVLPAQPATGAGTLFTPFGGDGRSAPLGVYDVDAFVVGDASGGNAVVNIDFDARYTNLLSFAQAGVLADTAAGEFQLQLSDNTVFIPNVRIVGTLPGVTEGFVTPNSVFLWYPPPLFLTGAGRISATFVNVDATETYDLAAQIYVFDRNVRQISPAQLLNMVRITANSVPAT